VVWWTGANVSEELSTQWGECMNRKEMTRTMSRTVREPVGTGNLAKVCFVSKERRKMCKRKQGREKKERGKK
jgi:hypothetical protein